MEHLSSYIKNQFDESVQIDEMFGSVIFKKIGLILISSIVPYLISLGIKISSLNFDNWVKKIIKKYPKYEDAIITISTILRDEFNSCIKCKDFINKTESQSPSKYNDINIYRDEILSLINSEEDKQKVKEFFDFINSEKFKEDIDEL